MAEDNSFKQLDKLRQNSENILDYLKNVIEKLTVMYNSASDTFLKIKDKNQQNQEIRRIILKIIVDNPYILKKDILEKIKDINISDRTIDKYLIDLVNTKIFSRINRTNDPLKKSSMGKLSYDLNLITLHFLDEICNIIKKIDELPPLELNGILDHHKYLIEHNLVSLGDDRELKNIEEVNSSNLEYSFRLLISCNFMPCVESVCQRLYYNTFKDVIDILGAKSFKPEDIIIKKSGESKKDCIICFKIKKKGGD